jgi:predicted metal-dependent phosphoesterase TrpH
MSDKPCMTVIDYAGNAGRHKIVQAGDVLGGKHPPATQEYAKQTLAEEKTAAEIKDILDRATAEMALEEQENQRRARITAEASYTTYDVDPFTKQYNGQAAKNRRTVDLCSKKQAGLVCHLGRQCGENWTFAEARALTRRQVNGVIHKLKGKCGLE